MQNTRTTQAQKSHNSLKNTPALETLMSLGLTHYEAIVYDCLISEGELSPINIEKHTGLHRPFVYKAILGLIQKNLITTTPNGKRKNYVALSPDKLNVLFRDIESSYFSNIEELHARFNESKLSGAGKKNKEKPVLTFSTGEKAIRDGYRSVANDLNKGDTYYRYNPGYNLFNKNKYLPKSYQERRDAKGLERFVITNQDHGIKKLKLGKDIRVVPKSFDLFNDRISLLIFKDKVMIIDYDSESVITIKHAKFAEFQKKIFKLLYSKL